MLSLNERVAKAVHDLLQELSDSINWEKKEPVSGVVIRDGYPILLKDSEIRETDQRLYTKLQPAPVPDYKAAWHKVWPDSGSFVRASADDLERFAKAVSATNTVQEPVAYLFTNVQSGDIEASCDPDHNEDEREMWHREPLVRPPAAQRLKSWVNLSQENINYFQTVHCVYPGTLLKIQDSIRELNENSN
jgi:hypothetical protein